jgi:hypothetical protein
MFNYVYIQERRIYALCATVWGMSRFDYVDKLSRHVWYTPFSSLRAIDYDVMPAGGWRVWRGAQSC